MTSASLAGRLRAAGLPDAEAAPMRRLLDALLDDFRVRRGEDPESAWWIPGRLEMFGKHTDYAGGHSVVAAVPRGFLLLASRRADSTVWLRDAIRGEEFVPASTGTEPGGEEAGTGWPNYVQTAVRRLRRNFPGAVQGADIVFGSDLPSASGMSSSSALVTGVAAALVHGAGLRSHPRWTANIRGPDEEAGYYACIENGMAFGSLEGDAGVGTHGGSEDHVAIVCGTASTVSAWRFVPIRHIATVGLPPGWTFVVAASGVAARKTGPAREHYNRLSHEAGALLALWRREDPAAPSLHAALASDRSAADRLLRLTEHHASPFPRQRLRARLFHFIREDARVLEAVAALRAADHARLGTLSAASQEDAERLLGNQVAETTALARSARELGAFAATSFGAGFGGSVWALVEEEESAAFADRWIRRYREQFPHRGAATAFAAHPGPGLTRLD